jgi:uncharacterized protein (TIGR00645 family)
MVSSLIERFIFWSRWLLAPLYLGLIAVLIVLVYKFAVEFWALITHIGDTHGQQFTIDLLALLDIVLLGNLILIVLFAGYENFVSKIETAEDNVDRPAWMGHVDFSGLKIKLIGSLVAISVIELLKDFIELATTPDDEVPVNALTWRLGIHLTFVISGVLFAVMDWISDNRVLRSLDSERNGSAGTRPEVVKATKKRIRQNAKSNTVL